MDLTQIVLAVIAGIFSGGGAAAIILAISKSRTENRTSSIDYADRLNDIATATVERLTQKLRNRLDEVEAEAVKYKAGFELASSELGYARRTIDDYEVRWANAERDKADALRRFEALERLTAELKTERSELYQKAIDINQKYDALKQALVDEREVTNQVRAERDAKIADLAQRLESVEAQLADERRRRAELEEQFEKRLAEKDAEIADLKRQLAHKDHEIAELRQQLAQLQDSGARLVSLAE